MTGPERTTAILILGLVCLIMPVVTWVVLARQHSRVVGLWCGGYLLCAGGLGLIGLRGDVPIWASVPGANLLVFMGLLASLQALRLDQGMRVRPGWLLGACLGYLVVFALLWLGLGKAAIRIGFIALTMLFLQAQVARSAWRIGRREQSPGAMAIAGCHLLLAITMLLRLAELVWKGGAGSAPPLVGFGVLTSVGVLAAIVGNVGFIGLALERSLKRQLEAAASRARLEERHALGNEIAQLDRQRGFGLVAASLAHELNQPLTAILASAQAARRGCAAKRLSHAQSLKLLDKVILNTRRVSDITERIRGFIRPALSDPDLVDLGKVTREMLDLVTPDLRSHDIRVAFPAGTPPVLVQGDAIQLSQVVLNVLRNAIDAAQQVQDRSIQIQLTQSADEALLRIRDTGPGIDPGVADRVGRPYFTTKEEGLGMGLSISMAILGQHHGGLLIGNAEGGGACVDIWLPLLAGGAPCPT